MFDRHLYDIIITLLYNSGKQNPELSGYTPCVYMIKFRFAVEYLFKKISSEKA
jgi:hypothetical protein